MTKHEPIAYDADDENRPASPHNPELESDDDPRTPFQHDRDRIIHSSAFRRLQGKTQVYGLGASDYYRSRLTHSVEVAQIGKALALRFGADLDLVEAICLAHDIGHPPFGHAGEQVLHERLKKWGGFNGNAQNLRIVAVLESKSTKYLGLNLTKATLDGLIKYPNPINPFLDENNVESKKGYYERDKQLVDQFKSRNEKTFECQLMNWADDVAYSSHDLEDALVIGTIRRDDLERDVTRTRIAEHAIKSYRVDYPKLWASSPLEEPEVERWINHVLTECIEPSSNAATKFAGTGNPTRIAVVKSFVSRHIHECVSAATACNTEVTAPGRYSKRLDIAAAIVKKVEIFKAIVFISVIRTSPVFTLQHAGMQILRDLFDALTQSDNVQLPYLFPLDYRKDADDALRAYRGGTDRARLYEFVRDFIASMTDANCEAMWRRMFSPGGGLFTARV